MKAKHMVPLLGLTLLVSCIRKETAVAPHDPGNVIIATTDMGEDYRWQVYYNLQTHTMVGRNLKTDWDLGFETSADGYRVVLNSARQMYALRTHATELDAVSWPDTTGLMAIAHMDHPGGHPDSTAIGDWRQQHPVYILGNGDKKFYKMQMLESDAAGYRFRFASMGGQQAQTLTVPKDSVYNFSFVSLEQGKTVQVEPPKKSWDLVFTGYTHIFYDLNLPYSVTGCLLNRYHTAAARDSLHPFSEIVYKDLVRYQASEEINAIGYDWKSYSIAEGKYTVDPSKVFLIRTASGQWFKLHFTGFVKDGVKGHPAWEYQQL